MNDIPQSLKIEHAEAVLLTHRHSESDGYLDVRKFLEKYSKDQICGAFAFSRGNMLDFFAALIRHREYLKDQKRSRLRAQRAAIKAALERADA